MPAVPTSLPSAVGHVLSQLRRRIRWYVLTEGAARLVVFVGALFWITLAIDWTFELSVPWRALMLLTAGVVSLIAIWRLLLSRLVAPISDESLALILERHDATLADGLATTVTLSHAQSPVHTELAQQTNARTASAIQRLRFAGLFRFRPLLASVAGAGAVFLSITLLNALAPNTFGHWLERLTLSPERWPRRVQLQVLGFETSPAGTRSATMARHDDFELQVRARLSGDHVAPRRVSIRFRLPDGRVGRDYLTRVGDATVGNAEYQGYRYTFKNVREDLTFDLFGGDDQLRDLHLRVVDRPELIGLSLRCNYPTYLGRPAEALTVTRSVRIAQGSDITIQATASKPLVAASIRSATGEYARTLEVSDTATAEVHFTYGQLDADDTLLINFQDIDGITNREPYRASLVVIPDEVPEVSARLAGIGTAVTPQAQIPIVAKVTDDYGLARCELCYAVDQAESRHLPQSLKVDLPNKINVETALDLRDATADGNSVHPDVAPGSRLVIWIEARDACDLRSATQVGSSQRFALDVVTPAELLLLLERRELAYRQRFETIVDRITDTRSMLARIDLGGQPFTEADDVEIAPDAVRAADLRRLRVTGALQNISQATEEVASVADGFHNLHDQLVNNRIADRVLQMRLREQIAVPLADLSHHDMPAVSARLSAVDSSLPDVATAATALRQATEQTDALLVRMQEILERMLELESYNEVVALLRGIISDQEQLNNKTRQRRQQGLRDLLEE